MYKKHTLVMLPTNEKAQLVVQESGFLCYTPSFKNCTDYQHLYILSDEEIKEGDWCYDKILNLIFQTDKHTDFKYINQTDNVLKIIATTDKSLSIVKEKAGNNVWVQQLPQIPQQFIEHYISEYNKNNQIKNVLIEYETEEYCLPMPNIHVKQYRDILKINSKDNTITIRKVKDSWSREEVIELLHKYVNDSVTKSPNLNKIFHKQCDKWINDNL